MAAVRAYGLHATGTTTNANSGGVEPGPDTENVALEVNIEAVGATPTVTIGLEGSFDGTNYFPVRHVPSDTEVAASTVVLTTTGRRVYFFKNDLGQFFRFFRAASSGILNVTYSTTLYVADSD